MGIFHLRMKGTLDNCGSLVKYVANNNNNNINNNPNSTREKIDVWSKGPSPKSA